MMREAAAMKNFLWIDSQDLAGVADVLMRQVGVWLFGVQRAKQEIWRALEHMPEGLPAKRPRPADIATLSKGQFYVCFGKEMHKVYVQPAWMAAAHAEAIARGEEEVESAREILKEYAYEHKESKATAKRDLESQAISDRSSNGTIARVGERDGQDQGEPRGVGIADSDREEAMWKEKYEALKKEFDLLSARMDELQKREVKAADAREFSGNGSPAIGPKMGEWFDKFPAESLESVYQYIRKRLAKENPAEMLALMEKPSIEVKIQRPVLPIEGNTLQGRICQLITEGFFKQPQSAKITTAEAVRRGWCHPKTPFMRIQDPLDKITGMGFLTREADGYLIVPGMKINIVEA